MDLLLLLVAALQDARTDAVKREIDRAIRELGSEDTDRREAAHAFLAAINLHLRESLGKAAASADPEVVQRAQALGHPPASELERKVAEANRKLVESETDHTTHWRSLERRAADLQEKCTKQEAYRPAAFELWIDQWDSPDPDTRRRAKDGLVREGMAVFPVLREISTREPKARTIAEALHLLVEEDAARLLRERLSSMRISTDYKHTTLGEVIDGVSA